MTNELTDVRCPCGTEFPAESYDAGFIAGSGMCQNCDAALPPKDICTCPSGDGSLRHPCPAHPAPVEQAGGDERAAFRPAQVISYRPGVGEVTIYVAGRVPGYMNIGDTVYVSDRAPVEQPIAALAQPSPAQAEQAEPERPEVVAWQYRVTAGPQTGWSLWHPGKGEEFERSYTVERRPLMTVAQHERIVKAWIERWKAYIELSAKIAAQRDAANARLHEVATACATAEQERDAALAEVERLRESKGDPSGSFDRCMKMMYERDENAKRLDAALARVAELDKQCRDDVARALGLRPSQERGFAWSYLLASIKSCVKASEDAAQAQHSVPEEFSFEYRHPNGECHTVTVSREQVINEMPDFLFEALCSKFCNCDPVGETNVVECCCDEYAEEFKLIDAAPGKEVGHE
ncbi:TPA: hypothetical protein ACQRGV_000727 [Pseudomonas aeruginosa]|uniref:hypothetical protein n=1 Tax=Pseudomonas aeruginosa TaxID=287 RepID=UPI00193B7C66|nr:hypothetical protein [Pseudomonas aeruginosa]MBG7362154.1 hypothetical protein [Pseudomonas aeruginosa]MBH8902005.1 hypothetical protein [Pseudomonas aeruginosa]MBM2539695.1 hypothetical protein [Pseudomonas aeruginosa]HBO5354284.1 hypothetical protein [Pseudomonas aeruginosa]HCI1792076.1 hypothetical protein [Pseudomonas aeruginosa]